MSPLFLMKCLGVVLLSLGAGAGQEVLSPAPEGPFELAQALAPGEARAHALIEALPTLEGAELQAGLRLAFDEFVNQTSAYRMDLALPLAEEMHARAQADWSAMSYSLACTRAGRSTLARRLLLTQLERSPDGPQRYALLERLGLAALGAQDIHLARQALGSAFAEGSNNAGVVLGALALREGRTNVARSVFRGLLEDQPAQSWAHRGWGLSMLPRRVRAVEAQ